MALKCRPHTIHIYNVSGKRARAWTTLGSKYSLLSLFSKGSYILATSTPLRLPPHHLQHLHLHSLPFPYTLSELAVVNPPTALASPPEPVPLANRHYLRMVIDHRPRERRQTHGTVGEQ
jgi:hypothetical protein